MQVFRVWCALCMFGTFGLFMRANEVEYEGNYADNYDNEISLDQQERENQPTPCHSDFTRWDKLFIALEDSHMRQNMLLESMEQCCGGMHSLRNQLDRLAKGTCLQNASSLRSACKEEAERSSLRFHHSLVKLREEESERERAINATLQMILHIYEEGNARLKNLEEAMTLAIGGSGSTNQPGPGGLGPAEGKVFLRQREMSLQMNVATMERSLVTIATELQRVHLHLSKVIEQAGTLRQGRGDT